MSAILPRHSRSRTSGLSFTRTASVTASITTTVCILSTSLLATYADAEPQRPAIPGIPFDSPQLPAIPSLPGLDKLPGANASASKVSLTVTPERGLKDGDKVSIKGSGYKPGAKIYLTQTIEQPSGTYPSNYGASVKVTVGSDGGFDAELPVSTSFNDVDCTSTQCYVASFSAFPNLADRSNDFWVPIHFDGSASAPSAPATGASSNGSANSNGSASSNGTSTHNAIPANSASGASDTGGAAGAATSASGATVSLSKSDNLNPAGDTVRVSGKGFKTSGQGIYVGIAQQNQMNTTDSESFSPDTIYVSKSRGNLNADGSFSVDLPVSAKFGNADCLSNACAIYTIAAHGSSDRSQDTVSPVSFAGGVARASAGSVGGSGASSHGAGTHGSGAQSSSGSGSATSSRSSAGSGSSSSNSSNSAVSVSLSTTQLAPEGTTTITVTGSGFKTTGNGVYVAVAEKSKFSTTNADAFTASTYVRTSQMTSTGGFTTTISVDPATAAANCLENQCALYTFAAHGSSDRSQDTVTDLTITGGSDAAKKAAAKAEKDGKLKEKSSKAQNKGTGSRSAKSTDTGEAAPVTVDNDAQLAAAQQQMHPVVAGSIGAVVGALILGSGLWLGRRSTRRDEAL